MEEEEEEEEESAPVSQVPPSLFFLNVIRVVKEEEEDEQCLFIILFLLRSWPLGKAVFPFLQVTTRREEERKRHSALDLTIFLKKILVCYSSLCIASSPF